MRHNETNIRKVIKMKSIYIKIEKDEMCGYTVYVNGEVLLECLAEDEVGEITVKEIAEMYEKYESGEL